MRKVVWVAAGGRRAKRMAPLRRLGWCWPLGAALLLAAALGQASHPAATAQDEPAAATPATRPSVRVPCAVPDPANRPPLTDGTGADAGVAVLEGTLPDPELSRLAAALDQLVDAFAACMSAGDHRIVAELATGRHLGYLAGIGGVLTPEMYVALASDLPIVPVSIRSIDDVRLLEPDTASADVIYVVANQLVHGRWSFVKAPESAPASDATDPALDEESDPGDARWLIDGETPLPVVPPTGAIRVTVELDEYEITLSRERVSQAEHGIVLNVTNEGEREHETLVLRLDQGADTADLLRQPGPRLPEGMVFAGQVTVPAGGQAELILVDLVPGRYALVSLLLDESGVPDLARGMGVELQVG